jgi:hypothetical protein
MIPVEIPFATMRTGHYLGMKYIHDKTYELTKMYCLRNTHLIVINK